MEWFHEIWKLEVRVTWDSVHVIYYSESGTYQAFNILQFISIVVLPVSNSSVFKLLKELEQVAWVGAAYDEASTWEHLLPAISKEGEECGVAMVTKILPDPPAARELALFLNPLTLTTLGKSLLGCLWPRFDFCTAWLFWLSFPGLSWVRVTTSALNTGQGSPGPVKTHVHIYHLNS